MEWNGIQYDININDIIYNKIYISKLNWVVFAYGYFKLYITISYIK